MALDLSGHMSQMCLRAVEHRAKYPAAPVSPVTFSLLQHTWTRLIDEGLRLQSCPVPTTFLTSDFQYVVNMLHRTLARGLESAAQVRCLIPPCAPKPLPWGQTLKIGVGNPGKTGCVSIEGSSVSWSKLIGRPWSAKTAMEKLGLHILGLPAARLREDVELVGCPGWNLVCRGGPSYFSCAVMWENNGGFSFEPVSAVGSDCRIWMSFSQSGHALGFCVFLAMPTQASAEHETRWHLELEGLDKDLQTITSLWRARSLPHIFLAGDFNVQPACLSGQADPKPKRDLALRLLLDKWSLSLLNPSVAGERPCQVQLPLRKQTICIRAGDTHHAGNPRAIDLVICSNHTHAAEAIVHNGLHCASTSSCSWGLCADFCLSDHFLVEVSVSCLREVGDSASERPQTPRQWHMKRRWASTLVRLAPAVKELSNLVKFVRDCQEPQVGSGKRATGLVFRRWILDCLCWVQSMFASIARDGWVHPARSQSEPRAGAQTASGALHPSGGERIVAEVKGLLAGGNIPTSVALKCFKFFKKHKVPTPVCMRKNGALLSPQESHEEWCLKLRSQCSGPEVHDANMLTKMQHSVSSMMGRAWQKRGQGLLDTDVSEPQIRAVLSTWKASTAITPDLIPRAAFVADNEDWISLIWLLCQLAGPARFALRPTLWRWSSLGTAFKKGPATEFSSWRLLFVRSQMGLLQEGVLALRLRPAIWSHLLEGQSGYIRSSEDPVLALTELRQLAVASQHRCVFVLMGDFEKAFPSCWRNDILHLAAECPLLSGGALHLLGDILDSDSVSVGFGGFSVVPVLEGLPEGGCLGPLLYPLIPNSLTRVLLHEKCGVALDAALPKAWKDHQWSGQGVPQMSLVARILDALHADAQLPSSSALQAYPDLEASAARALDLRDPGRLAILLHADDPVLLASSWGELCRMILMIERWAPGHGARFHVSDDKSVVFRLGGSGQVQPIFFRPSPSAPSLSLCSDAHRWLGWLWTEAGGAAETLQARIRVASGCFSTLAGLCTSQAIPLPFALNIFEGKVDACMRPGRWIYAVLVPDATRILDDAYDRWAKIFLGVPAWLPAHAVVWELGWPLSGMARAVFDVAVKRARIQCWPADDLYRRVFETTAQSTAACWSTRSLQLLHDWGIAQYSDGDMSLGIPEYKRYVKQTLAAKCLARLQSLVQSSECFLSWRIINPDLTPSKMLTSILKQPSSWNSLLASRALCRLRLNLFPLGHLQGSFSRARVVSCIACGRTVRGPLAHMLLSCEKFAGVRGALVSLVGSEEGSLSRILCLQPGQQGFEEVLALAQEIQKFAFKYWRERSRPLKTLLP